MFSIEAFQSDLRAYMSETGVPPSRLGREATGDPTCVIDIMKGARSPRMDTVEKLYRHMADAKAEKEAIDAILG